MKRLLLITSLIVPQMLYAQETERILLPLNISSGVAGAYGSLWGTTITLTNHSDAPLQVYGYGACHAPSPVKRPCRRSQSGHFSKSNEIAQTI